MLVITRRLGERFFIGDDITITVTDIDYGKVRIGIEAPRDVSILREELRDKRRAQQEENNE